MCYVRKSTDYNSDEKGLTIQICNRGNTIRNLYHLLQPRAVHAHTYLLERVGLFGAFRLQVSTGKKKK